ncbi:MAG: glutamyl-tRNA reductase [Bacteroidia bacterium]|nr:glutamyl-tRNA reductase [Bacteroidia bacterium]
MLNKLFAFTLTHKTAALEEVGKLVLDEAGQQEILPKIKQQFHLNELYYLATCNRVELYFTTDTEVSFFKLNQLLTCINPTLTKETLEQLVKKGDKFEGLEAVNHLLKVSSSLDSLVVGEREIITQVRKCYDFCKSLGITGDLIRLLTKQAVETAKEVYTTTEIAGKPVSVVSLAYRELRDLNVNTDARVLIVGAGVTNTNLSKYLKKHGFKNFTVFNRTLSKAQELAQQLKGVAYPLTELENYTQGFDVLLTCTGAPNTIITPALYTKLLARETTLKFVIDLAVPNDFDIQIKREHPVELIEVKTLETIAQKNLEGRGKEIDACKTIIARRLEEFIELVKEREVELKMREIPLKIREIKENIFNEVFTREINQLDDETRFLLEKVVNYMEKKCISVPMKLAREIMLQEKVE